MWQTNGVTTTVYVGDLMEITLDASSRVTRTYYYAGSQRVAMRIHDGEYAPLYYLHNDHLGSTSLATHGQKEPLQQSTYLPLVMSGYDGSGGPPAGDEPPPLTPSGPVYVSPPDAPEPGTLVAGSETRYTPYGEVRTGGPAVGGLTDFTYGGQQVDRDTGLMYYNARWYDPALGRFVSADTIVPDPGNPQDLNRYAYVRNSPLNFTDPSGRAVDPGGGGGVDWEDPTVWEYYYWLYMNNPDLYLDKLLSGVYDGPMFAAEAYSKLVLHEPFMPYGGDQYYVVSGAWREELSRAEAGQVELLNLVTLYGIFYQVLGPCEYATQLGGGGGGGNAGLPTWPQTAEEMDELLGFGGRRIPNTASTPGRNKVVWEPSNGCVVPLHRELAIGTLRGILRQARVTPDEFVERL